MEWTTMGISIFLFIAVWFNTNDLWFAISMALAPWIALGAVRTAYPKNKD